MIADQDDVLIGIVRLSPIDTANRSARLGMGILDLAPPSRRASAAKQPRLALAYGFDHLDLIG